MAPSSGRGAILSGFRWSEKDRAGQVDQARANRTKGKSGLTTVEREDLARLRKENRQLRMDREILVKASAFFVKHHA